MRPHFLHNDANYGVNFLNTTTYVSLLSVDWAWFVSRLYHTFIARTNSKTLRGLARALSESALQSPINSSKRTPRFSRAFTGPKRKNWFSGCPVVRMSGCTYVLFMTQRRREPRIFLAEPPRREKLSHRPPHTIVHALSKFELHWFLLRCVRVWGMLGPNFIRTCLTEAPRKFHFAHFSTNCCVN